MAGNGNQPTSFRFPFSLPDEVHPGVRNALRLTYNGVKDLNDAVRSLNDKVEANKTAITEVTNVTSGGASPAPTPTPTPPLIQLVSFVLTSAQVLTLKAAPIQLLTPPGVSAMYLASLVLYQYKFVSTPYTVNAATDQYLCVYSGTQPTVANVRNGYASILANGFMDQVTSQVYQAPGILRAPQALVDNGALFIGLPSDCSAELLAGDGTLTISAEYATGALT